MEVYDYIIELNRNLCEGYDLTLNDAWIFLNTIEWLEFYSDLLITDDVLSKIYEMVIDQNNSDILSNYLQTDKTSKKIIDDLQFEFEFDVKY